MEHILAKVMLKLMDKNTDIRLWARVLPWVLMGCLVIVSLAFAYSLVR